jgi:hypothetical protein
MNVTARQLAVVMLQARDRDVPAYDALLCRMRLAVVDAECRSDPVAAEWGAGSQQRVGNA